MYWCLQKCCDYFFFRIQSHLSLIWKTCSNFLKKNKRSIVNRQAMFLFVPLWRIQDEVHAGNLTFNRENEAFLHFDIVLRQGDSERTVQVFVLLFQGKELHTNACTPIPSETLITSRMVPLHPYFLKGNSHHICLTQNTFPLCLTPY